jgi:hypothetical protein
MYCVCAHAWLVVRQLHACCSSATAQSTVTSTNIYRHTQRTTSALVWSAAYEVTTYVNSMRPFTVQEIRERATLIFTNQVPSSAISQGADRGPQDVRGQAAVGAQIAVGGVRRNGWGAQSPERKMYSVGRKL